MSASDGKEDQCERAKEGNVISMGEALPKNCTHNDPVDIPGDIEEDAVISNNTTDSVPLASTSVEKSVFDTVVKPFPIIANGLAKDIVDFMTYQNSATMQLKRLFKEMIDTNGFTNKKDTAVPDGDCSVSASSEKDSCSTSSSAKIDYSNECSCGYCDDLRHGYFGAAPRYRTDDEMRERLKLILTGKLWGKNCKYFGSIGESIGESNLAIPPQSVLQLHPDERNVDELLDFIEGNQNGKKDNNKKAEKKAEKKARQKQRKLLEKMKKDRQEAEK